MVPAPVTSVSLASPNAWAVKAPGHLLQIFFNLRSSSKSPSPPGSLDDWLEDEVDVFLTFTATAFLLLLVLPQFPGSLHHLRSSLHIRIHTGVTKNHLQVLLPHFQGLILLSGRNLSPFFPLSPIFFSPLVFLCFLCFLGPCLLAPSFPAHAWASPSRPHLLAPAQPSASWSSMEVCVDQLLRNPLHGSGFHQWVVVSNPLGTNEVSPSDWACQSGCEVTPHPLCRSPWTPHIADNLCCWGWPAHQLDAPSSHSRLHSECKWVPSSVIPLGWPGRTFEASGQLLPLPLQASLELPFSPPGAA